MRYGRYRVWEFMKVKKSEKGRQENDDKKLGICNYFGASYFSDAKNISHLLSINQRVQLVHEDLKQLHDDDFGKKWILVETGTFKHEGSESSSSEMEGKSSLWKSKMWILIYNQRCLAKAMCAIDGAGFDWSDMAKEENSGKCLWHLGILRKNRTLIEVVRTMLADSKLPITFWAEAVSTACYV
ncbi:putative ribonuclease H-like domain-containing protein [Tanacetum coccineum]